MSYQLKDKAYNYIINNIINNKDFLKIDSCRHHGITRLEHSLRVSYYSYKVSKFLKLDARQTARAGLLHDFFIDEQLNKKERNEMLRKLRVIPKTSRAQIARVLGISKKIVERAMKEE